MTWLEKYESDNPDASGGHIINSRCPGDFYEGGAKNLTKECWGSDDCTHCWNKEIPENCVKVDIPEEAKTTPIPLKPDGEAVPLPYKPEKTPSKLIAQITPKIDVSKLIDEAMEKKDRYVTVFVNNEGHMSVNVYPYEKDEPRWIPVMDSCGEFAAVSHYECSECGHIKHYCSPYCSMCGEKLKLPDSK